MNTHQCNLIAALSLCAAIAVPDIASAVAISVPGQGTWETTLQGRDLDGKLSNGFEAYYDTSLNITWLANATSGSAMTWATANAWATNLNINGNKGVSISTDIET